MKTFLLYFYIGLKVLFAHIVFPVLLFSALIWSFNHFPIIMGIITFVLFTAVIGLIFKEEGEI